jgi:hypothetical protein
MFQTHWHWALPSTHCFHGAICGAGARPHERVLHRPVWSAFRGVVWKGCRQDFFPRPLGEGGESREASRVRGFLKAVAHAALRHPETMKAKGSSRRHIGQGIVVFPACCLLSTACRFFKAECLWNPFRVPLGMAPNQPSGVARRYVLWPFQGRTCGTRGAGPKAGRVSSRAHEMAQASIGPAPRRGNTGHLQLSLRK